jgi:class 3 adenylate cyclase/predicted ATPase
MTFDDILAQVITLLKRQGRVSYRALKMRFDLDDEYLDVLKEELIDAQRIAMDEGGRILVWVGESGGVPLSASLPLQTEPQSPVQYNQPTQSVSLPTEPRIPEAERRQLTVMFCDLVDSTKLSSQLDPEDYRDTVRAYQNVCTDVIQRYEGHVAQLLGDGLLVYFGYPHAHEDDAQRAVRAGLGMLAAMEDLQTRLQREKGIQLALRMGIHTGLVVVGDMGSGGRQEQLALGETPNIAARIQGLAEPNTLVISDATYRLVQGYFDCEALGAQTLRGVAEPITLYQVLGESGVHSRLDIASAHGLTPLVGRESEVTLLLERWAQAKSGHGQVVLLTGDAGIGKSRLVQVLKDHVANEPHTRWECRSLPYYQNTALYPLTDLFQRTLQWQPDETPEEKLEKLELALSQYRLPVEETVPLFAPLLALPLPENQYSPLNLSPQRQRQKTLETIVTILQELAERQPMLFIVEDLHWTDPTTLELLNLVIDQTPTASMLVLLTCRPHFQPAWHHRSYLTEITVNRLSHALVGQFVNRMTDGKALPPEVLQQIIAKTDGVPLFVEECAKSLLESGQLKAVDEHYELIGSFSTFTIPATLQDSLMARLDRLVTAKAVAQYAAVIGRQFPYALLQAVSQLDEAMLQHELGRLVEAEIVYQRGLPPQATYMFKHALIQDAAAQSLLKSTRQHYHLRIAQVLETQFPETTEAQPELLAHHYTEASLYAQAVRYWHRAGQRAHERSAHVEAIRYLHNGLDILHTLPESAACLQYELDLQTTLAQTLKDTKGYGDAAVAAVYRRAWELCQQVPDAPQRFQVLLGQSIYYLTRVEFQTVSALGEQLLSIAQRTQDVVRLVEAHYTLGVTAFWLGRHVAACEHLEQGITHYEPHQHRAHIALFGQDGGAVCLCRLAHVLWYLGYPEQALRRSHQALTLVRELVHPFSAAYVQLWVAWLYHHCREPQPTQAVTDTLIACATEQGFPFWASQGTVMQGWLRVQQGQVTAGIAQIQQGLVDLQATGGVLQRPYCLSLLAEAYGQAGQSLEGLQVLAEALTLIENNGERYYEAEMYRLKGELLLQQNSDNQAEAETCFHQAIAIAQNQQAKSLELRAATSLARLWQQGKRQEAHDLLAPVYNWFTEGFDTADLQDAKALLEGLEEEQL